MAENFVEAFFDKVKNGAVEAGRNLTNFPLAATVLGAGRGMRAAGVNAGTRSREFYRQGKLPVLSWPPAEGTSAPVG